MKRPVVEGDAKLCVSSGVRGRPVKSLDFLKHNVVPLFGYLYASLLLAVHKKMSLVFTVVIHKVRGHEAICMTNMFEAVKPRRCLM
jgi:hypothetical protein